jgi:hypothetical protein
MSNKGELATLFNERIQRAAPGACPDRLLGIKHLQCSIRDRRSMPCTDGPFLDSLLEL